jgi:hypothetical protein
MRLLITLLLLTSISYGQWQPINGKQRFTNGLGVPAKDTSTTSTADSSMITIRPQDSSLWVKYKGDWYKVPRISSGTVIDTTKLAYLAKSQTFTGINTFNNTIGNSNWTVLNNGTWQINNSLGHAAFIFKSNNDYFGVGDTYGDFNNTSFVLNDSAKTIDLRATNGIGNITSNTWLIKNNGNARFNDTITGAVVKDNNGLLDSTSANGIVTPTMLTAATPQATSSTYGLVKVGSNISVSSGTISINNSNVIAALGYMPYNASNPSNYIARTGLSANSPINYASSTGVFSLSTLDSTNVGGLHSENYYNTKYLRLADTAASLLAYQVAINGKQVTLVSGTNIKTVNGSSLLGSGNIVAGVDTTRNYTWIPSVTASSGLAKGQTYSPTLAAAANNDTLVGIDLQPTFTANSKTGLTKSALRYANGNIVENGAVLPSSYGTTDFLLKQDTKLISTFTTNNTYYGSLKLMDNGAQITLATTYGGGKVNFTIGSNTSNFDGSGNLNMKGVTGITNSGGVNIQYTGAISAQAPNGTQGNLYPMNSSGQTVIQNGYNSSSAGIVFSTSPSSSNTYVEAGRFSYTGAMLLNTTTDDAVANDKLQVNGNINIVSASGKLKINAGTSSTASVGTATMNGTTAVTISTTAVTSSSIILITYQNCSNCGTAYVSAKTAGTSFTVTSTNALDASTIAYQIIN